MTFLKTSHDGEVMFDHRASPGLPEPVAQKLDLPPELLREGMVMHAPTLGCPHCGSAVMLNPMRKRARAHCFQCNMYICDGCDAVRHDPDYVHRTFKEVVDMVQSKRFALAGGSASRPRLIRIGD